MVNRRKFIRQSAALSAGTFLLPESILSAPLLKSIGINFFSLPKMLEKDLAGTLSMLSKMGYKEVELYGPYPFSTEPARKRWDAVTPALGFSGSGFFGHTIPEVKKMFADQGLSVPSMHTDLDTLQNNMGQLAEAAHQLGTSYVVLPAIPDEIRQTLDDYRKIAENFNRIGESARKNGIKFTYHNHGYGISPVDGQVPLQIILDGTDPALVYLEMDLFWTIAGGADPLEYLTKYKNRYRCMHVKDMTKAVRFSGDGGNAQQWIALFPFMTSAGSGVMDLRTILAKAKAAGVQHFFVEQDMVADPEVSLKKSIDYLSGLKK
ncbi:sugar phosphate isomerase/epimerase family protein [Flavihumibacter fluvii]|uniref:sugar phosphate isomerase/epimerase family protein n=1 Tax=Flavihumibacter fluvii TaxID=2838157 RepID=UPI001BDF215D|nr:sugar phosphate isomerase/epimerase [Flavihumibacter fluvii]ULQ50719.1 sugar phosphate isomerase/epimerase [Flavihumibacter fluvii]